MSTVMCVITWWTDVFLPPGHPLGTRHTISIYCCPIQPWLRLLKVWYVLVFSNEEDTSSSRCSIVKAILKLDGWGGAGGGGGGQCPREVSGHSFIRFLFMAPPHPVRHQVILGICTFSFAKTLYSSKVFMPLGCIISWQDLSKLNQNKHLCSDLNLYNINSVLRENKK